MNSCDFRVILICFLLCVCIFGIHNCLVEKRPNEEPQIVVDVVREEEIDFSNSSDYNQFKSEYPLNGKNRGERHIHFRSYDSQSEYPTNV